MGLDCTRPWSSTETLERPMMKCRRNGNFGVGPMGPRSGEKGDLVKEFECQAFLKILVMGLHSR